MTAPEIAIATPGSRGLRLHNRVFPLLFIAGAVAAAGAGFVTLAPNRLVSGHPIGLFGAADWRLADGVAALGFGLLVMATMPPRRALYYAGAIISGLLLLLALIAAGEAATALAAAAPRLARISLGAGFWVLLGAAALAIVDGLQRAGAGPVERLAFVAALGAAIAGLVDAGCFDSLSLAHEYRARQGLFAAALLRHALLVAGAVGPAVLIGLPLGIALVRRPGGQGPVFAVLNLLQTIPSIALFGILLVPLSALAAAVPALAALGVGGIGVAPALIALVLYALLPIVRNSVAGLSGVDPATVDAARGMGLTPWQLLWQVELPLALPLLLAGLRIVIVQAIGLTVIAALIGAGGLGSFVFEGLGQYAADLVLLGALPAILLALAANFLLDLLAQWVARR